MSRPALPQSAVIAISTLAVFGVVILFVTNPMASDDGSVGGTTAQQAADCTVDNALLAQTAGGDQNPEDALVSEMWESAHRVFADQDDECLAAGEAMIFVIGLPGVSGTFSSRNGNMALEGWSLAPGAEFEPVNRCFVDDTHIFRSKAVVSLGPELVREWRATGGDTDTGGQAAAVLITIDLGRTGGGDFAAVVAEAGGAVIEADTTDGVVDESTLRGAALFQVTHNYNPGQPDRVKATINTPSAGNWTGVATFRSTGLAHTYNDRDYAPWTDSNSRFAPDYPFTIILVCK